MMAFTETASPGGSPLAFPLDGQPQIPRYLDKSVITQVRTSTVIKTRTITDLKSMAALRQEWNELASDAATSCNGFQSFDWCYTWAATHCSPNGIKPHIVTVYHAGQLVLVWPLMTTCIGPICILRWMSDPFGQYGDVIARSNENLQEYLGMAWNEICQQSGAASVRLRHVRKDSTCYSFLQPLCEIAEQPDRAPYLDLTQFKNVEEYDARYTRTQRRRRKKIRKEFEKFGEVEFVLFDDPQHTELLIDQIINEKNRWLRERGHYSAALSGQHFPAFLKELARQTDSTLKLVTTVITAGHRTISYEIGLRYKDRHMCFITAHDNELTDMSPGRLHMHHTQRQALNDGCATFDLMVPGDPYKDSWSNDAVETVDFSIALNAKGRLFSHGFLRTARPIFRKIYHAAPAPVRRKLIPLVPSIGAS